MPNAAHVVTLVRAMGGPEHETSPQGACFPRGAMDGGSEENPQPMRTRDGEAAPAILGSRGTCPSMGIAGVPGGEGLVRR